MILAPFKWIVALFFNWSQALFHDPGWAVVGMSVLLSLLLTPLYIWIERRKNSDKAKSAPMQAEIDKIEAVYTGRERFYYTREIQRRYHYSPWTAMIPTLGLLVQIPFLLAAYHYLSELPLFNGVGFWYIKDLSKPDTIAVFAGLPINLLAILMTVINLVSGWRYAESGKPKERIQYMAVAAIFLFLLYNCAASVVLYWTLSNALSFVRSEIFFRKKTKAEVQRSVSTYHIEDLCRVSAYGCLLTACFLFLDGFLVSDWIGFKGFSLFKGIQRSANSFLMVAGALSAAGAFGMAIRTRRSIGSITKILLIVAAGLIEMALIVKQTGLRGSDTPVLSFLSAMFIPLMGSLGVLLLFFSRGLHSSCEDKGRTPFCVDTLAVSLAVSCIGAQLTLCGPLVAWASFPSGTGDVSGLYLLILALVGTCILPLVFYFVSRCLPSWLLSPISLCVLFLFAVIFTYGNLIPFDYGVLFEGNYSKPENVRASLDGVVLEAMVFGLVVLLLCKAKAFLFASGKNVWLRSLFSVVLLSFLIRTVLPFFRSTGRVGNATVQSADGSLFTFSKSQKNVVFVLLDNVMGLRGGQIVGQSDKLRSAFDGFVWYPYAISAGSYTFPNLPAIWGGEEYFPHAVGNETLLQNVFVNAWNRYRDSAVAHGYDFACTSAYKAFGLSYMGVMNPQWLEMQYKRGGSQAGKSFLSANEISLTLNPILRSVPLIIRDKIYDGGRWHIIGKMSRMPFDGAFDFLEDLARNSIVVEKPKGTYVHIHSEATHSPFMTRINGRLKSMGCDSSFKWSLERVADWLLWMKEQGIYDNTRIVVCSDHGVVKDEDAMVTNGGYVRNIDRIKAVVGNETVNSRFALLMVKDFGSHGAMKVDKALKTVSHGAYFALDNPKFFAPVDKVIPSYVENPFPADWATQKGFKPVYSYSIEGDASDGKNWRKLED